MTEPPNTGPPNARPPGRGSASGDPGQSHPEVVLSQALRAMAGGPKPAPPTAAPPTPPRRRLGTVQVLLIAALVGLLLGVTAGLLSLVL